MGNKASTQQKGPTKEIDKDSAERIQIIDEIIASEEEYVNGLEACIVGYRNPLVAKKSLLQPKKATIIFSNIEVLHRLHHDFLSALKQATKFTECRQVGRIIAKSADSFKEYTHYINNCSSALETLARTTQKHNNLEEFLQECAANVKLELPALLMLPIQRIPRYVTLFSSLVERTPMKHADYKNCIIALEKIQEVAEFVNQEKRIAENMQNIYEIEKSIQNCSNLVARDREFVQEGDLMLSTGKQIHYFLFTDLILLVAKASGISSIKLSGKMKRWKLIEKLYLLDIEEIKKKEQPIDFIIKTPASTVITIRFDSINDRNNWVDEFYSVRAKAPPTARTPSLKKKAK